MTEHRKTPDTRPELAPPTPEVFAVPENTPEQAPVIDREQSTFDTAPANSNTAWSPKPPRIIDPVVAEVETILEDGLGDLYYAMDEVSRQQFKMKGEETATAITELVQNAKATARSVVKLIVAWLKVIPGVSRLFIEQEAKIKTDRVLALEHKRKS